MWRLRDGRRDLLFCLRGRFRAQLHRAGCLAFSASFYDNEWRPGSWCCLLLDLKGLERVYSRLFKLPLTLARWLYHESARSFCEELSQSGVADGFLAHEGAHAGSGFHHCVIRERTLGFVHEHRFGNIAGSPVESEHILLARHVSGLPACCGDWSYVST